MLLKFPEYRLDGALWVFEKMVEYGYEPHISDFPVQMDAEAKAFLIK